MKKFLIKLSVFIFLAAVLPVGFCVVVDPYNVFHASLLIRHSEDGKKYLYDIIDIKKETSYPLEP